MSHYLCTAFFNQTRFCTRFEADDVLVRSVLGFMEIGADTDLQAAEEVFRQLNHDYRPNGRTERSLSVGDVVRVESFDSAGFHTTRFACDERGWRIV